MHLHQFVCRSIIAVITVLWPRCERIRRMDKEDKPNVIDLMCDGDTSKSFSDSGLDMTKQRFALWILKTLAYTRFLNVYRLQRELAECDDELVKSLMEEGCQSREDYSVDRSAGPLYAACTLF